MSKPVAGVGLKWRVIRDEPLSGTRNMALDHALAMSPRPGEGVLRLYSWQSPTVSFGRNEPAKDVYDTVAAARCGVEFVRRPTGGRAVLHDMEATYAVVVPDRMFGGPKGVYLKVNQGLAHGLGQVGAAVSVSEGGLALPPDSGPCFQVPAPGEVMAAGRKLVGSAQVRLGSAILQHGSIIIHGDQSLLSTLGNGAEDAPPPATLFSLIGEVDGEDVADALTEGLQLALGGTWDEGEYRSGELAEADWLEGERYNNQDWTWRV
ncbi:MAG: biotin/lipoate A/B protein ligase family protein [Gemmatimonadetes bacterium]|nr:biotin/lipoate A/B protein ligase family protein [Gemmatimonadota bacterium]